MQFKNILVIKLRYLGDVLLATPVVSQLHRAFPQARITMLVSRGTEAMLAGNPDLYDVLVADKQGLLSEAAFGLMLRRRRYDCVIDLTDGDRAAILTWITAAPVRVGFNQEQRWRGMAYTAVAAPGAQDRHRIERDLSSLRALGLAPEPGAPVLAVSSDEEDAGRQVLAALGVDAEGPPLVMVQPGARYWFKAWPAERFVELADRLTAATACQVLVGGSPQEQELATSLVSRMRGKAVNLAGRLSVRHYAAILKRCALFVGNDAGPMHMAAALGTPIVGLFGPSDPAEWGPRSPQARTLYKGLDCRRCFHPTCERGEMSCMKQISVEEVFQAALTFLSAKEVIGDHI